jgi:aspartyl-tRNA(Asn)/glutamyl-tRNA(Gln) amidotransferase subunit A
LCTRRPEIALEQARAADARMAGGDAPAMCGIPLGIKDLFCTKGVPSQAASNILKGFKPEYESTVTAKLFECGRGDAGQAEHGRVRHGVVERDLCYGNAVNPWKEG